MRSTKDGIIDMWVYGVNKVTIFNFAYSRLEMPKHCKSEHQKRGYVMKYINYLIRKEIKQRRNIYEEITN